jgi:Flp pilus assembly protein TadG
MKDASRQAEMKRLHGENGVELLEFALVIPIFVFVLYGLIAFGIMLSAKQTITNAVAEGARAAVGAQPNPGERQSDAETRVALARVNQAVGSSLSGNYRDSMTQADVKPCANDASRNCITVTLTYPYSSKPLVPSAPGLGLVMPNNLTATAVVQVP